MVFRTGTDNVHVRKLGLPALEEGTLLPVRLEKVEVNVRTRSSQGESRRAATGAHIDDRAVAQERYAGQRVVEMEPSRCFSVPNRCQSWSLEQCREPALKPLVSQPA